MPLTVRGLLVLGLCVALLHPHVAAAQEDSPQESAIVIGSGFAGSVAAYHLARVGVKTIVLEKGLDWTVSDPTRANTFPSLVNPDGRTSWLSNETVAPGPFPYSGAPIDSFTGLLQSTGPRSNPRDPGVKIRTDGPIRCVSGVGVGGGSLIGNGVMLQPTRDNFQQAMRSTERFAELWRSLEKDYFPKAKLRLLPEDPLIPSELDKSGAFVNGRLFREQAVAAGYEVNQDDGDSSATQKVPCAIEWDQVQEEVEGERVAAAIQGDAWAGLNSGVRRTLSDRTNYMGAALETGSVTVLPLHQATRLRHQRPEQEGGAATLSDEDALWLVDVNVLSPNGRVLEVKQLTARYLFVAAGSLETTALLVKARDTGDLPSLPEEVGGEWGTNGDTFGVRHVGRESGVGRGGPASYAVFDHRNDQDSITVMPVGAQWAVHEDEQDVLWHQGVGVPDGTGRVEWDTEAGEAVVRWPADPNPSQRVRDSMEQFFQRVNTANRRSKGEVGPVEEASGVTTSALGGVPYFTATDDRCRVRGYDRLYVVDGSLLPGSAGLVQPALTITAMAERCMERITEDDDIAGRGARISVSPAEAPVPALLTLALGPLFLLLWVLL